MPYCSKCGLGVDAPGAVFCPRCGATLKLGLDELMKSFLGSLYAVSGAIPRINPEGGVAASELMKKPVSAPPKAEENKTVDFLARLEELRQRGEISDKTYEKLKREYWERIEKPYSNS